MSTARERRLLRLALTIAAVLASALRALPLLGLIGSLAAIVNTRGGSKRRAAKAAAWGSVAAIVWLVVAADVHVRGFGYAAPAVAAAVAFALNRTRAGVRPRRRQRSV